MLYGHAEPLATVVRLRQRLKSLRAYLFSCRAAVAEDLRRSREKLFVNWIIFHHLSFPPCENRIPFAIRMYSASY